MKLQASLQIQRKGDADLHLTYCAFVICTLLIDWSGVNMEAALEFVRRCRVGVRFQVLPPSLRFARPTKAATAPHQGAKYKIHIPDVHFAGAGGPAYLEMGIFRFATNPATYLSESGRRSTLRWLLQNQDKSGGSHCRTNKDGDARYCFWCGGAIQVFPPILLSGSLLTNYTNRYLERKSS